jgi:hypothetical protein
MSKFITLQTIHITRDPEKIGKSEDSDFYKICINLSHIRYMKEMTRKEAAYSEMASVYSNTLGKKWADNSELITIVHTDGLKTIYTYEPLASLLERIQAL